MKPLKSTTFSTWPGGPYGWVAGKIGIKANSASGADGAVVKVEA